MTPDSVKVALELARGVDPIAGRLVHENGETVEFSGWLELTAALDDARSSRDHSTSGRSGSSAVTDRRRDRY
jgi:hypothetical protein